MNFFRSNPLKLLNPVDLQERKHIETYRITYRHLESASINARDAAGHVRDNDFQNALEFAEEARMRLNEAIKGLKKLRSDQRREFGR